MKRLLIIAGSDSGGGAGIQADIKTACAHGVFATTAITAVTAQNTQGVLGVEALPAAFVAQQIKAVLDDIGTDAIKIGMLANAEIINAIDAALKDCDKPIILDTVMVASSGDKLLDDNAIDALINLAKHAMLVTPNIPEAEILAEMKINNVGDMQQAAHKILLSGAKAVLLKGGHMQGKEVIDILVSKDETIEIKNPKISSSNTHGTGCTLASAIACNLANGQNLQDATKNAVEYVRNAIKNAPNIGTGGNKPLNHNINN